MPDKIRERKPLFALALSLFLPGMGQVYNGRPRKGILFFVASLVLPFLLSQLSVVGPGQTAIVLFALSLAADPGISIWAALDAWRQAKRLGKKYKLKIYNKLVVYILPIVVVYLFLFIFSRIVDTQKLVFWAAPYRTETGAMAPTILPGDFILADKRIGYSSKNAGLIRGELVVLKLPSNKKLHVMKRVIGLSGDEIELRGMELFVNEKKWPVQEAPPPEGREGESDGKKISAFYEKSDSGVYRVFYFEGAARDNFRISVPEGCCFVLGDNRDVSADSRHWGSIALSDIVARARFVYFSRDPKGGVRWARIGKLLENTKLAKSGS
jgi:signal peptidase I